jgi:peptide/nickel transport system permease protein
MLSYIIRRILLMIPTLLGITLLVFLVMALSPGGITGTLLSAQGTMDPVARRLRQEYLERRYGLDRPLLVQYGRWLNRVSPIGFRTYTQDEPAVVKATAEAEAAAKNLPADARRPRPNPDVGDIKWGIPWFKTPDLGESFMRQRPVSAIVKETLPVTLLLNLVSIPIVYAIAITVGIYSARHRGKLLDVASGTVFLGLWSIPTMWAGVMMLGFLADRRYLGWFPTDGLHDVRAELMPFLPRWGAGGLERGWLLDWIWHLVLPVICLSYTGFAFLSKLMRAAVLENLSADFARTARAKGLPENAVLFRHVLSNSLLPLITMAATILPGMLGGSIVVERIFTISGMGNLTVESIMLKDQEVVLSLTLVIAVVSVMSVLIADVCYAVADPRITYD